MLDLDAIADVVAGAVREATTPLVSRLDAQAKLIEELEQRPIPTPLTVEEVRTAAREEVTAAVEALPPVEPLPDFASIAADTAKEQIAAFAATLPAPVDEKAIAERVLKAIPPPEKGDPGEVDMEQVRTLIDEMTQQAVSEQLAEAVKAIPAPEPVEPIAPDMEAIGKLIQDGIDKVVAELPPPAKGEPGIGLASGMIDRQGDLVLTFSNGETRNVGRVVGKDGAPGATFTLDDFDLVELDDRTLDFRFTKDGVCHSFEKRFPVLIGRGIWSMEGDYERGDVVTWGGTAWEAVEPEKGVKPDLSKGGWRILSKRGRDGKDAK